MVSSSSVFPRCSCCPSSTILVCCLYPSPMFSSSRASELKDVAPWRDLPPSNPTQMFRAVNSSTPLLLLGSAVLSVVILDEHCLLSQEVRHFTGWRVSLSSRAGESMASLAVRNPQALAAIRLRHAAPGALRVTAARSERRRGLCDQRPPHNRLQVGFLCSPGTAPF